VPYPILLGVGRFDPAKAGLAASESSHGCEDPACPEVGHELGHSNVFSTESYETDLPLSLDRLREALKTLPPDVYRAKGIVNSADAPRHRVVVQIVGRRVDITIDDEWGERTPRTQIVAIGAMGSLADGFLEEACRPCLTAASADRSDLIQSQEGSDVSFAPPRPDA
jgi:G3E family GTPase